MLDRAFRRNRRRTRVRYDLPSGNQSTAPNPIERLLRVVARARAQVRRIHVQRVVQLRLINPAIRIRVVVHDTCRIHDTVRVLAHLLRRRAGPALLLRQRILIRELRWIRIQNRTRINTTEAGVLIPPVIRIQPRLDQQLQQLITGRLGPALLRQSQHTGDDRSRK